MMTLMMMVMMMVMMMMIVMMPRVYHTGPVSHC